MTSFLLNSGISPHDYAPHPIKVIIYEDSSGLPLFESKVFGNEDLTDFASDRMWYVAKNLYNLANSVDLDVKKGFINLLILLM
jgi:hypothetical protein